MISRVIAFPAQAPTKSLDSQVNLSKVVSNRMPLSWNEIKARSLAFSKEWEHDSSEDAEAKSFWDGFFLSEKKGMIARVISQISSPPIFLLLQTSEYSPSSSSMTTYQVLMVDLTESVVCQRLFP